MDRNPNACPVSVAIRTFPDVPVEVSDQKYAGLVSEKELTVRFRPPWNDVVTLGRIVRPVPDPHVGVPTPYRYMVI